jgi:hypothetical protein
MVVQLRLPPASSSFQSLIVQRILFRSKVDTVTHTVALKSFTPYGRTRRPSIGSFPPDVLLYFACLMCLPFSFNSSRGQACQFHHNQAATPETAKLLT